MRILLVLLLTTSTAFAAPGASDTTAANGRFSTLDGEQTTYHQNNSRYRQDLPNNVNAIEYKTDVYEGPRGKGYIHTARKYDSGEDTYYIMQKHIGPESDRLINISWVEES